MAPSLPELTDKEEAELDRIIDRFIQADTGKIAGSEARKAMDDFKELGPEATFALLRGFNKSAHIDHKLPRPDDLTQIDVDSALVGRC